MPKQKKETEPLGKVKRNSRRSQKTKRTFQSRQNEFSFIRFLRMLFFLMVTGFIVYLYALFENGELLTILMQMWEKLGGALQKGSGVVVELVINNPFVALLVLGNNLFFILVGYGIARKDVLKKKFFNNN